MSQAHPSPAAFRSAGGVAGHCIGFAGSIPPGGVVLVIPPSRTGAPPSARAPITVVVTGFVEQPKLSAATTRSRPLTITTD